VQLSLMSIDEVEILLFPYRPLMVGNGRVRDVILIEY